MSVRLRCPHGHPLRVSQQYFGDKVPCPSCRVEVDVPNEPREAVDALLNRALHPSGNPARQTERSKDRRIFNT